MTIAAKQPQSHEPAAHHSGPIQERRRVSSVTIGFKSQTITNKLFGPMDHNLQYIEDRMSVKIGARGTELQIEGANAEDVEFILRELYRSIEDEGEEITSGLIDAKIRMISQNNDNGQGMEARNVIPMASIKTRLKTIVARSHNQANYINAMQVNTMTFGLGPAGTGKTYLACAHAVSQLIRGDVERLIFSRPAVDCSEKLGFLPGDLKEKVDPYMRPLYDALNDCMPSEQVERRLASGEIEIAPIAFMRGRTLKDAVVILDEAQNATREQMKMFLTRLGENSQYVICGDPLQSDLPKGQSGLSDAVERLTNIDDIEMVRFNSKDVVRHELVGRIVDAYEG